MTKRGCTDISPPMHTIYKPIYRLCLTLPQMRSSIHSSILNVLLNVFVNCSQTPPKIPKKRTYCLGFRGKWMPLLSRTISLITMPFEVQIRFLSLSHTQYNASRCICTFLPAEQLAQVSDIFSKQLVLAPKTPRMTSRMTRKYVCASRL